MYDTIPYSAMHLSLNLPKKQKSVVENSLRTKDWVSGNSRPLTGYKTTEKHAVGTTQSRSSSNIG
jgi:hypothetical protein